MSEPSGDRNRQPVRGPGAATRQHARPSEAELRQWIEQSVDEGATTVEEIHRAIADLPLGVLERLGIFEATAKDVRHIQDVSIGAVYDCIRKVNHEVSRLAGELLDPATRQQAPAPASGSPRPAPPPKPC